jgi:hypothetical protein
MGWEHFKIFRSALMMLYTEKAIETPSELVNPISNVLGGIKRSIATERQNGIRKSKERRQTELFV